MCTHRALGDDERGHQTAHAHGPNHAGAAVRRSSRGAAPPPSRLATRRRGVRSDGLPVRAQRPVVSHSRPVARPTQRARRAQRERVAKAPLVGAPIQLPILLHSHAPQSRRLAQPGCVARRSQSRRRRPHAVGCAWSVRQQPPLRPLPNACEAVGVATTSRLALQQRVRLTTPGRHGRSGCARPHMTVSHDGLT